MNKELNLVEILKDCPHGTKLWSPAYGVVKLVGVTDSEKLPIMISIDAFTYIVYLTKEGKIIISDDAEVMLFPSKENRDWSTFKAPTKPKWNPDTLQPFDKVLVRDDEGFMWRGDFFLFKDKTVQRYTYACIRNIFKYCIPFNEETKHLLGTNQAPPEFYRI